MHDDPSAGFSPDMLALLRDREVSLPGEKEVLAKIYSWTTAPALTPSAPRLPHQPFSVDRFTWGRAEAGSNTTVIPGNCTS